MLLRALFASLALSAVLLLAGPGGVSRASAPSSGGNDVWGNLDCHGGVTPNDALVVIASVAGGVDTGQDASCPPIGAPVSFNSGIGLPFGDINCSGTADLNDALGILGQLSGATSLAFGCFNVGSQVSWQALGDMFTPGDSWRDYGDAPDGAPTGYNAGAVTGHFPTLAANDGPTHVLPPVIALGEQITSEDAPNAEDSGDEGLLYSDLHSCAASSLLLLINTSGLTEQQKQSPLYVNVFADWDQDGTWTGASGCAPEAAVTNQPVDVSASGSIEVINVDFTAGEVPAQFWMRVMLTTAPYTPGDQDLTGETEDYLVAANSPLPQGGAEAAQPQYDKDKAGKEFVCKGGWVPHGNGDMTIDIEQTQASKEGGFRPKNPTLNFGPVQSVGFDKPPEGVQITKVTIDASTLSDGRVRYRVTLSITSKHDAPDRLQGPLVTDIKIKGTDQKNQQFKGSITCGFYIDHSEGAKTYNPDTDGFQGGPGHGGTGPGIAPQPFYVIEHGKKPTVFSDATPAQDQKNGSTPDKKSITVFGSDGAQLAAADYKAKAGIDSIKTGDKGRGLVISTVKDNRDEPVQSIVVRVDGTAPDGTTKWRDYYRVIIVHETGAKKKQLIDDLNLYYVSNPVYPENYAFAINYVANENAFVEKTLDIGGLTFDPQLICNVATQGDSILSPVAGELAFVLRYASGASDLVEFERNTLPDNAACEDATNLTNYGPGSIFAVEHPTWCWGGGYGFTELNRQASTFRQAFVPEDSPFPLPLPNGDGYRNATCFPFPPPPAALEPGQPQGLQPQILIGLTARKPDPDNHGSDVWYLPFQCALSCVEGVGTLPIDPKLLIDVSGLNVHALGPVVSPDGTMIAWVKATLNDDATEFVDGQIWVGDFDIDTLTVTNERQLTTEGLNVHPAWSPRSNAIIFDSNRDGNVEIYLMNKNGDNQVNLTQTPNVAETQPSWETP